MPPLDDIVAFVTGASQGIGRQIALTFADRGADVACAARSEDAIAETASMVEERGSRAVAVRTDVTVEEEVESAIATTTEELGGLDCLVNNAGIGGPVQPFDHVDPEEFTHTQEVNVTGPLTCTKHAGEHLRASDRGSVVNIGSIGGKRPYQNRTAYAASKMGLIGLTRTLAYELGHDEVTVNTVLPGPVRGPRIERVMAKQEELAEQGFETADVDESDFALPDYVVEPEEVAEQVAYLAGPHARHVTAQEIAVDSGGTWY
jgi:NAD(P)-dependent dehydrogenase (short-subunit alcohol dehydrogenase family)